MRDHLRQVFRFRRNVRLGGLIGVLLIAGAGSPLFADEIIQYANTCVEQESGDVAGCVVILSDGEPLPSISLNWSEGALMLPVAAKIADCDRMSDRLAFNPYDGEPREPKLFETTTKKLQASIVEPNSPCDAGQSNSEADFLLRLRLGHPPAGNPFGALPRFNTDG